MGGNLGYTYVENNPLTNTDPTGHWCTSSDGKWAHPGQCSDSSSTFDFDINHDSEDIIENGVTTGTYYFDIGPADIKHDDVSQAVIDSVITLGTSLEAYTIKDVATGTFKKVAGWVGGIFTRKVASDAIEGALPYVKNAAIDMRKLTDYALNPEHPIGGNKTKVFESALGFTKDSASELATQILNKLPATQATEGVLNSYGQRYTVDIMIDGLNGNSAIVRTGWIIESGSTVPRLTTLFVK